ncbi:Hypothetical predicted protein [Paramuricea clavata]|uniref:Uncharacterized protein n=1 Tax=Paramuricea clavata TaxID=317549 RepID=A0A6S7JWK5_PARCT|nr:Hypothetical predicted protein [Paramuricea clavata]
METIFESVEPETSVASDLREKLLKLVDAGEIKYTSKYIKKSSEKTLENIYKDYERQRLENTNSQLADVIITKFSELMEALDAVKDAEGMKKELEENDLLRKDIKNLVSYVTPVHPTHWNTKWWNHRWKTCGQYKSRANREVVIRFWLVEEGGVVIMGVNAMPFGPPIGVVVFLTVPEGLALGEIDSLTLDGPEFGVNLGRPNDSAELWVFSIPSLRARSYGMGNLFRIRWKDRSVTPVEYENSLPVSGVDAL